MTTHNPIAAARRRLKLTQTQLAPKMGVDPATVSRWERAKPEDIPRVAILALGAITRAAEPPPVLPHPCSPLTAALLCWDADGIEAPVVYAEGSADLGDAYAEAIRQGIAAGWTGWGLDALLDGDAGRYYTVLALLSEALPQLQEHATPAHADRLHRAALDACRDPRDGQTHPETIHPTALEILHSLSRRHPTQDGQARAARDYRALRRLWAQRDTTATED